MYKHKEDVLLRKLSHTDLPQLLELKSESWWGTHNTSILNSADQQVWYTNIPANDLYMIAEINSIPVGVACYTGLDWISRTVRVSGSIYKSNRTLQISQRAFAAGMDFAFEILNMRRIEGEVLETHAAAQFLEINLMGMKIEGRRRQAVYKSGKYYDSILLGMLREEWESQDRVKSYGGSCNTVFDHEKAQQAIERFNRDNRVV